MSDCWRNRDASEYRLYQRNRKQLFADNLEATGGKCTLAIDGVCTGKQEQAHHIYGVCAGMLGPIVPACGACNRYLGNVTKGKDPAGRAPTW